MPGAQPSGVPAPTTPLPVGAWSGPDGVSHPITSENLLTDSTWFLPAVTVARLVASPLYVLSYIGSETHDGQAVVHISVMQSFSQVAANLPAASNPSSFTPPAAPVPTSSELEALMQHLSEMDLYLDPTSLLPVALAFDVHPDNDTPIDIPTEVRFSDYQATNGVQLPLRVQRSINNGLVLDLQLTNATINSGLSASAFNL